MSEERAVDHALDNPLYEHLIRKNEQLRQALESRDIIGQAKGIIRLLARCDDATAFGVLSCISQRTNRKLRDVAAVITDSGASGSPLPKDIATTLQSEMTTRGVHSLRDVGHATSDAKDGPRSPADSDGGRTTPK